MEDSEGILKKASEIASSQTPEMPSSELKAFVKKYLARSEHYDQLCITNGSPLYIFEKETFLERAAELLCKI